MRVPLNLMSRSFCASTLLLALVLSVGGTEAFAQDKNGNPSAACLAFKKGLSLGMPLARTKMKLQAGETLRVVAIGSSSTTGFGLLSSRRAFPDIMTPELLRLRTSAQRELINTCRILEPITVDI